MTGFPLHDLDSAPAEARDRLAGAERMMGFIPNVFAKMAEAPTTLEAYQTLDEIFGRTSLSSIEREVVLIAVSVENPCHFCVAAHSGRAKQAGMDGEVLSALRAGGALPDARLHALAAFTRAVVAERGWVGDERLQAFIDAGFTRQQALEVVLGVSIKTLSNDLNHIAGTPLNAELEPLAWHEAA